MSISEILSIINNLATKFRSEPTIPTIKDYVLNLESRNSELQDKCLEMNDKYLACIKENSELRERIKEYEDWNAEKSKYEISEGVNNTILYRKKDTEELFCPNCFESKKQTIHLQPPFEEGYNDLVIFCPNCKGMYVKKR